MKEAKCCLQVDVGNSGTKWRLLKAGSVVARGRFSGDDESGLASLFSSTEAVDKIWVSSVASADRNARLAAALQARWGVTAWFARTVSRTGNLVNSYAEPERMGIDRWLAMLGGQGRLEGRFAVIDAGSALTVDIVAASGVHEGGYIIPGAQLMERALLLDTDRVRFDEEVDYSLRPGCSTAEAVRHGIAVAQAGAVAMVTRHMALSEEQLLFCGGGAQMLVELLSLDNRPVPDIIFEGLAIMAAEAG